jgi:antitoxin HicB
MSKRIAETSDRELKEIISDYLAKPYYRVIVPEEDGTFRGEIFEFPGCIATGETRERALSSLEETAFSWLGSALSHGQTIPEPMDSRDYSGKLVLRLSRALHKKATVAAELDGVSLNQFIAIAVAEAVGERPQYATFYSYSSWQPVIQGFTSANTFTPVVTNERNLIGGRITTTPSVINGS